MNRKQAEKIIDAIIEDLRDRRGLKHEWAVIDSDTRIALLLVSSILSGIKREIQLIRESVERVERVEHRGNK